MTTEEIRKEWCKIKGFNYIDFDTLKEAEEYILFLESRIEALSIADVSNRYSIEDIERCVENWGMCKVEKEYIERFLNGC